LIEDDEDPRLPRHQGPTALPKTFTDAIRNKINEFGKDLDEEPVQDVPAKVIPGQQKPTFILEDQSPKLQDNQSPKDRKRNEENEPGLGLGKFGVAKGQPEGKPEVKPKTLAEKAAENLVRNFLADDESPVHDNTPVKEKTPEKQHPFLLEEDSPKVPAYKGDKTPAKGPKAQTEGDESLNNVRPLFDWVDEPKNPQVKTPQKKDGQPITGVDAIIRDFVRDDDSPYEPEQKTPQQKPVTPEKNFILEEDSPKVPPKKGDKTPAKGPKAQTEEDESLNNVRPLFDWIDEPKNPQGKTPQKKDGQAHYRR
jgi:hypothetical protein